MKSVILTGLLTAYASSLMANTKPLQWSVKHQAWSNQHEKEFSEFVLKIGKAKANKVCHTTEACLRSSIANPKYASLNPPDLGSNYSVKKTVDGKQVSVNQFGIYSDCADLPFILRGYFAWMNDLPFSYPVSVSPTKENEEYRKVLQEKVAALEERYNQELSLFNSNSSGIGAYDQDLYHLNQRRSAFVQRYNQASSKYQEVAMNFEEAKYEYNKKGGILKKKKVENLSAKLGKIAQDINHFKFQIESTDYEIKRISALKSNSEGSGTGVLPEHLLNIKKEIEGFKNGPLSIRYTKYGNKVNSHAVVKNGDNINGVMVKIRDAISTAHFRVRTDTWVGNAYPSFYSPAIKRETIQPGTVLYDTDGHVAMVYEVTDEGTIFAIDAHPDNSLTRIEFNSEFNRSPIYTSGGFLNWRPLAYDSSAKLQAMSNQELAAQGKLSFEQYMGNHFVASSLDEEFNYKKAVFIDEQTKLQVNFYEFVESRVRDPNSKIKPIEKFNEQLDLLCSNFKSRATSVDDAIKAGISTQLHPDKLPANIYGTVGDWEVYATPSTDLRRRIALNEFAMKTKKMVASINFAKDSSYDYSGDDLVSDLRKAYETNANKCKIDITKSNGQKVSLTLASILANAYKLSFDPYHCAELRWGIYTNADYQACQVGGGNKVEWYIAQQKLRNSLERDTEVLTNLTIEELEQSSNVGTDKQEVLDMKKVLDSL
jgi:hypothetical protein